MRCLKIITVLCLSLVISACQRPEPQSITSLEINQHRLQVELADTEQEKFIGLSGRSTLCADCGMLFSFKPAQTTAFVMRDMNFALDMIGIREGRVVALDQNCPPQSGPNFTLYQHQTPVDYVLELNAGTIARLQIKIDDQVIFN